VARLCCKRMVYFDYAGGQGLEGGGHAGLCPASCGETG